MLSCLNKTLLFFLGVEVLCLLGIEALFFLSIATYHKGAHAFPLPNLPFSPWPSLFLSLLLLQSTPRVHFLSLFAFVAKHPKGAFSLSL
jgi:hypothetical protein